MIWFSPTTCGYCKSTCQDYLINGKTKDGPWATMCLECYKKHGIFDEDGLPKIGVGYAQIYKKQGFAFVKTDDFTDENVLNINIFKNEKDAIDHFFNTYCNLKYDSEQVEYILKGIKWMYEKYRPFG